MISLILIPLTILIYLRLNRSHQFIVFSLIALYPFTFGNFGPIPTLYVVEWLTIVSFMTLLNELVNINSINKSSKKLKYKGIGIFIFAFIILTIWLAVSYINNQILSRPIVTGGESGVRRTYFDFFNNVLLFFTCIIFFVTQHEKIDVENLFKVILYATLFIGFTRIFTFYFDFNTPLLGGLFRYNSGSMTRYGGVSYRFSGLDYASEIGIPAFFGLYVYKNKLNFVVLTVLLIFVFLSGGRTIMVGVVVSIIAFSFMFLPKNFVYMAIAVGILLLAAVIFLPQSFFEGQINRLSDLQQTSFMGQDVWRGTTWLYYLRTFLDHPIFGKGIGDYHGFIYSTISGTEEFVRRNLFSGGHGTYFSLLSTFGLGGIIYFLILILGGVSMSIRKIKQYATLDNDKTAIAVFSFMFIVIVSIDCVTGHNGYSDITFLFYVLGLICSIRVMENNLSYKKTISNHEDNKVEIELNKY